MKNRLFLILAFMTLILFFGCKGREAQKMPDGPPPTPFIYAPLPPFHEVFQILDYLKLGDYNLAIEEKVFSSRPETGQAAFALGVLTADGIISVRGHNKSKLNDIAEEMIKLSNFLGLDESILRLADQLKELISEDQWEELEKAMEYYKSEVEGSLYQSQQYDQFTMMQLGGWVEGINRIAWFVNRSYQIEKTSVLAQRGTLNHLISNLEHVTAPSIKDSYYFRTSTKKLTEIKSIIDTAKDDTYSIQQVQSLIQKTDEIKKLYTK